MSGASACLVCLKKKQSNPREHYPQAGYLRTLASWLWGLPSLSSGSYLHLYWSAHRLTSAPTGWGKPLTIHRFDLSSSCGRLFLRHSHAAALFNTLYFPPELLHRCAAVYRGLRVGATKGGRVQGFIGEHPVDSSAARNGFSEERATFEWDWLTLISTVLELALCITLN